MTKAEMVKELKSAMGCTTAMAETALKLIPEIIKKEIEKGGRVTILGLGSFSVAQRAARKGRNPQTGKELSIPAHKAVKFTPAKALKASLK